MVPDIVTMNRAHSTHYTDRPEPGIKHVLRGWGRTADQPATNDRIQDVHVRSIATNIRNWTAAAPQRHGNSIFIFEVASLCIAHLGHLHHTLNQQQLNEIGRVDVVLVPVDGGATLDLEGMVEVLQALKAPLMIPMHYFSAYTLNRFLERVREQWDVENARHALRCRVASTRCPPSRNCSCFPGADPAIIAEKMVGEANALRGNARWDTPLFCGSRQRRGTRFRA